MEMRKTYIVEIIVLFFYFSKILYNIVLISAVQRSELAVCIHNISSLLDLPPSYPSRHRAPCRALKHSKPSYFKNKVQWWVGGSLQAEGGGVLLLWGRSDEGLSTCKVCGVELRSLSLPWLWLDINISPSPLPLQPIQLDSQVCQPSFLLPHPSFALVVCSWSQNEPSLFSEGCV